MPSLVGSEMCIRDSPEGRAGVATHVVPADNQAWVARTWSRVREEVDAGHRVYVVCPRISPDDPEGAQAADDADLVAEPGTAGGGGGDLLFDEVPVRRPLRAVLEAVSYTHLRAHETRHDLVCRL